MIRTASALMAAVFALATAVQLNDPDPLPWMAIYGSACALSVRAAVHRSAPVAIAGLAGVIALLWGLWLESGVYGRVMPAELFEAWEMKDDRIETAREAGGLLLAGAWLLFLAGHAWHLRRKARSVPSNRLGT